MEVLLDAAVFLAAATVAIPLFRRLGLSSVLGYLIAGVVIGPSALRLVGDVETVLHFAEIGVVLLLFVIGLELHPARLRVLRRLVFGLGAAQVLLSALALALCARLLGLDWTAAIVVGAGLSLSSTAFVLQLLAEKRALVTTPGRAAFGVLLFQDLAVIPMIALLPLLAPGTGAATPAAFALDAGKAAAAVAGFVIAAHYLLRPLLRTVARARVHEAFTAAALLLVLGAGLLMESVGLSMGLGAFLAGVVVADSEYRHQLEADIEPFKGLLLGLFFISVGMSVNLERIADTPALIAGLTAGLLLVKAAVLYPVARALGLAGNARSVAMVLAQGGEFAFVLFTAAAGDGLLDPRTVELLVAVVTLSMAATPLLYLLDRKLARAGRDGDAREFDRVEETDHQVVVAGFGRFGQIVARILAANRIPFTALEASPAQVDFVRRFGNRIHFGDAARLDLLRAARVDKARVFVLAVDDVEKSVQIAEAVKRHFPHLALYARARNRQHEFRLMDVGADAIIRETLLSSLHLTGEVLRGLGLSAEEARRRTELFRRHDQETMARQYAVRHDERALIQSSRESAAELRELFEIDAGKGWAETR